MASQAPLTPLAMVKLAFAVAGLLIFGYGIRSDQPVVRWVGLAVVGIAFLLRFVGRSERR